MKYWLLIALFDYSGNYAGKVYQGPFPSESYCLAAQQMVVEAKGDPKPKVRCYTEAQKDGRAPDNRPPLFRSF